MSDAEMADVQMMQEMIKKLSFENDTLKTKLRSSESEWVKEKARRETYADLVDTFIEKLVDK